MIPPRLLAIAALAAVGALLPLQGARAQAYPSQPVKLVVPFPAGSASDNIARILGKELQDDLDQCSAQPSAKRRSPARKRRM